MENNGNIRLVHQENSIWVNINFLCVLEFSHYANIKVFKTIFQYIYMAHCISKFPSITTWKLFKRALNTSVDVTCFLHTKLVSTKTQYYQWHDIILFCSVTMLANSETTTKKEKRKETIIITKEQDKNKDKMLITTQSCYHIDHAFTILFPKAIPESIKV